MIQPGSTIGMLGSGQLGRMFIHAAQKMGYRVHVFSPDSNSPAGQAADKEIAAAYDDFDAVRDFAQAVDVVTLEFENIPVATVDAVTEIAPVHPGRNVLQVAQNRVREKTTIRSLSLPVPDFEVVESNEQIAKFVERHSEHGAVLKTAEAGYDGKGQVRIKTVADADRAWDSIGNREAIVEQFVPYDFEMSVVTARSSAGEVRSWDPILNHHKNHILDVSVAPSAMITSPLKAELTEIAESFVNSLEVVGVLCMEFFHTADGRVFVNEVAPRPHNSGHLTIEACVTSQFEQQVRAVCGLPLGSPEFMRSAAMVNLLGQHVADAGDKLHAVMNTESTKLHLYGKAAPNKNRKMGHITVTATNTRTAEKQARDARDKLIK